MTHRLHLHPFNHLWVYLRGKTRIALIDGEQLVEMLIKYRVGAVEKRLIVDALDEEWWGELLTGHGNSIEKPALPEMTPPPMNPEPPLFTLISEETTKPPQVTIEVEKEQSQSASVNDEVSKDESVVGRRPVAVNLLGHHEPVATWKGVLLTVCSILTQEQGEQFWVVAQTFGGKKRRHFADSPDGMIEPRQIPGTQRFVETNMNANSLRHRCEMLLVKLGYSLDTLSITLADQVTGLPQTPA